MTIPCLKAVGPDVELSVKIVPGASRDRIVGLLGDALKIQVAAPPEKGQANAAVVRLLAERLGIPPRRIGVVSGASSPRKVVRLVGTTLEDVAERLREFT